MKGKYFAVAMTAFLVIFGLHSSAQKIIDYPQVGFDGTNPNLKITKIVLTDSNTVLHFRTTAQPGNWIRIPKNTYIQGADETTKLFIKNVEGIPFDKQYFMPESGMVSYQLIFPAINPQTTSLDYGEDQEGGWKIYDIELAKKDWLLPPDIYTEWYNKKNGNLEIAFYTRAVVLENKVWSYKNMVRNSNRFTITLSNDGQTRKITVKKLKNGNLSFTSNHQTVELLADRNKCDKFFDQSAFHEPYLKNDSAVFSGYIKNYTPKLNTKTMLLAVDNIITGSQGDVLIRIQENGYFYQKIPLYHFQQVFLRSNIANENDIYLEPGKELFLIIGGNKLKYMGESAALNYDLNQLNAIRQFNYFRVQKEIVNMKPNDYKSYLSHLRDIENKKLDSVYQLHLISAKAYQLKKLNIKFDYASNMMEYDWIFPAAYKKANKLADSVKVTAEQYPEDYYDFIDSSFNKTENLLAPSFDGFINRIRFIDNFRQTRYVYNYKEIIPLLKKAGYQPDDDDKKFEDYLSENGWQNQIDSANRALFEKWNHKYSDDIRIIVGHIMREQYYKKLDSALNIKGGVLKDLMIAQEVSNSIVEQLTPLKEKSLAFLLEDIENPFIKKYISNTNLAVAKQVEANKKNGGYFVHATPTVEADKIFDTIIAGYKGKVVLVDFWATWCGPCLNSIQRIAPLKEDLKDKDIEFVYITNETSPLPTYNNLIPTIKGQHYRLKPDEWRYLADKFNISGIPHMVLVNKEGKVVNSHIGFIDNNEMRKLVESHL